MKKRWLYLFLLLPLLMLSFVNAQTREARDAVFADLGRRVGQTITLASLTSWTWNFGPYSYVIDLGEGCPAAPASSPTITNEGWQRFSIVYSGQSYEYVISDNLQFLYLCNEAAQLTPSAPAAAATPLPPTPTEFAPIGTRCALPTRLTLGKEGRVTPGDPNWVHSDPRRDSPQIGEIPGGDSFVVVDGPRCDAPSGMNYWLVRYTTSGGVLLGWTSEGSGNQYWLEPQTGRATINPTSAAALSLLPINQSIASIHSDGLSALAVSADGKLLVTADTTGAVRVWDVTLGTQTASFTHEGGVSALALRPDNALLATGGVDGNVRLWELSQAGPAAAIVPHGVAVTGIAFSPDGTLLATGSGDGRVVLWNVTAPAAPVLLSIVQAAGPAVGSLMFSGDSALLIARSGDGKSIQLWESNN